MQRRSQKLEVVLDVQAVSCPGVWLSSRGSVYLSICLLGHHIQTRDAAPAFPLMFHESSIIEKVFGHVFHLADLDDILEHELVYMELLQHTPHLPDAVLATFETSVREFLFPNITTTPQYSGADLDLLMEPTRHFPGALSPRLEVSTKTTVQEVRTSFGKTSTRRPFRTSRTEEVYAKASADVRQAPQEDSRPQRQQQPAEPAEDGRRRPPFVWRRADASLLGRQPGAPALRGARLRSRSLGALPGSGRGRHCHCACLPRPRSAERPSGGGGGGTRGRSRSLERPAAARLTDDTDLVTARTEPSLLPPDWCYHCGKYTTHHNCAVCDAYRRYFGRSYPGHHHRDCSYCYCPATTGVRTVWAGRCAVDSDSGTEDSCPPGWRHRRAYYESMEQLYRRLAVQAGRRARDPLS